MHPCWRKMKLKQRITCAFIFALTLVLVLSQTFFMVAGKLDFPRDFDSDWSGIKSDKVSSKGWRSKLEVQSDHKLKWASQFGHLNVPRKDLDASNNTSGYEQRSHEHDLIFNMSFRSIVDETEAKRIVQEHILKEDIFRMKDNIEKLLVAVDFIKQTSKTGGLSLDQLKNVLSPQNFDSQRFIFQNGQGSSERMKQIKDMEQSVNLSEKEVQVLLNVKPNKYYEKNNRIRTGKVLNLYDER